MRNSRPSLARFLPALLALPVLSGAARLAPPNVTVGEHLQVIASISLDEAAPPGGLEITLASSDPERVLLSGTADEAGSPTLKLTIRAGFRGSPEYYVQGRARSGSATYTASAPGFTTGSAIVTLAPSGFILARSGMGLSSLLTTTGAGKTDLLIHPAVLDTELNFLHPQPLAGGRSVTLKLTNSNPQVGTIPASSITLPGGSASSTIEFHPLAPGQTVLALSIPHGFAVPSQFSQVAATVVLPGMAISDDMAIGYNLQTGGALSLGEPAPAGGVTVTLTSSNPDKMLLSKSRSEPGSDRIHLSIPAGGVNASYFLQSLAGSGTVTYSAEASGFRSRTATVALTPSGLVIGGPQGPPDEAELLVKEIAEGPHGFVASLEAGPTVVTAYTVQLDPVTHRGADLTVQPVRPGAAIQAVLRNSNPLVGTVKAMAMTITGDSSSAVTHFAPSNAGSTTISIETPSGYTKAANSTSLTVTVKD
jgi:hypothetical protein